MQPPLDVFRHVVDVHCHPTDSPIAKEAMDDLPITICAMSTRQSDQPLVRDLANEYPDKVVACFGYHPWFSHWISIVPSATREEHYRQLFSPSEKQRETFERLLLHLPDPIPLVDVLAELRVNLSAFPQAMVGEVGLDRAARVPIEYTAHSRELTPFMVPIEHQLAVLEAQMDLAVGLRRNVSIHSVKSDKATLDLLDRMRQKHGPGWQRISIGFHSCGVSAESWRVAERRHSNVYMSLSTAINGHSSNLRPLIEACSSTRILAESDYNSVEECAERTWEMVVTIAEIKGWTVETTWTENPKEENWGVVRRLMRNWKEFQRGDHASLAAKQTPLKATMN